MTKWIVGAVIVIIIVGAGWFYRGNIKALFSSTPAQTGENATSTDPTAGWLTYASSTMGVSIRYPQGYTLNESYAYTQVSPTKPIHGISLTIPAAMATGTNLSSDTYISVEQLPRAKACTGDIFVAANVTAHEVIDNGLTYSLASTTGAAVGNRYEEDVWAIKGSQPCTAVRYFIHYGVIENYPPGVVQQYDAAVLAGAFDQIRRTLVLTGTVTPDVPSVQ